MILSAISKLLSADTTSIFVVLVFPPVLHQSLSKDLGQSYLYDLSALAERRKRNGECYCLLPVGNTPLSTQEHIKVDQSNMGSASAGSRKGGKMAGVRPLSQVTSTTSRCLSSRSEVILQESQHLSYWSAAKHHSEKTAVLLMDPHTPMQNQWLCDIFRC